MKYVRPPYDPDAEFITARPIFGDFPMKAPKIERPISIKENFKRAAEHNNPLWVPDFATDIKRVLTYELGGPEKRELGEGDCPAARGAKEREDFEDEMGAVWTFVPDAGGPMLKPGHPPVLEDITRWEKDLKWPDLNDVDFIGLQEKFLKENEGDDRVLFMNLGSFITEKLVSILGGYEQGMIALMEEPEAVKDFFWAYSKFTVDYYKKMTQLVKLDFVNYHDDFGTERDTFFSEKIMEDLVYEPTKYLVDTLKNDGASVQLHSCGKIERFVPYMVDLGINFLQIQDRANDMLMLKDKYGDKIGFNIFLGWAPDATPEQIDEIIHNAVDTYGKTGGMYTAMMAFDEKALWYAEHELYAYSREYYEK